MKTYTPAQSAAIAASIRRVTLATIAAAAVTLAALAVSALDCMSAESTDRSVANVARWTTTGAGPLLARDVESLPAELKAATWTRWSERLAARAHADRLNLPTTPTRRP